MKNKLAASLLFITSPFIAFIAALANLRTRTSQYIIWAFTIFFGLTMTVLPDETMDCMRYKNYFIEMTKRSSEQFYHWFFTEADNAKDLYIHFVNYLVSRFTDNYHIDFAVFGIIFGYFLIKSLRFLTEEKHFIPNAFSIYLALIFIISNSMFSLNYLRFWTAAWICVYSFLQIYINKQWKYLLLLILTPFVHGSFYLVILSFLLAWTTGKRRNLWFILFCSSFLLSPLIQQVAPTLLTFIPSIQESYENYLQDKYLQRYEDFSMLVAFFQFTIQPLFASTCIVVMYFSKKNFTQPYSLRLMELIMVVITISNFLSFVPDIQDRLSKLVIPLITIIWSVEFRQRWQARIMWLFPVFYLLFIYQIFHVYLPRILTWGDVLYPIVYTGLLRILYP